MKKLRLFLIINAITFINNAFSQDYGLDWVFATKDTLEVSKGIIDKAQMTDGQGNIYVTGEHSGVNDFDPTSAKSFLASNPISANIFLAKYTDQGNLSWAINIYGYNVNDMYVDSAGNVLLVGYFENKFRYDEKNKESFISSHLPTNLNSQSSYILKYDSSGNFVWIKQIDSNQYIKARSIDVAKSGAIYITGDYLGDTYFYNNQPFDTLYSSGSPDIFLAKFSELGDFIWAKSMGGAGMDSGLGLALDESENINLLAIVNDTADMDPSNSIFNVSLYAPPPTYSLLTNDRLANVIAQYDSTGAFNWCHIFNEFTSEIQMSDIAVDNSGSVVVTGLMRGSSVSGDFDPGIGVATLPLSFPFTGFVAKYNPNGNFLWTSKIGHKRFKGNKICIANDNSIFIAGDSLVNYPSNTYAPKNVFLTKCDSLGVIEFVHNFEATNFSEITGLSLTTGGRPVVSGSFRSTIYLDPNNANNGLSFTPFISSTEVCFISVYSPQGVLDWNFRYSDNNRFGSSPSEFDDMAKFFEIDENQNIYLVGRYHDAIDFDPSSNESILDGPEALYIGKYDPLGNYQWVFDLGSFVCKDILLDSSGLVNLVGACNASDSIDFDPSPNNMFVTSNGILDKTGIIATYSQDGVFQSLLQLDPLNINSSAHIHGCLVDMAGNFFITGSIIDSVDFDLSSTVYPVYASNSNYFIFLAKYDSSWNLLWAKVIEVSINDTYKIQFSMNADGEILITGSFSGMGDLDPSMNNFPINSSVNYGIFLAKYSANGDFIWGGSMDGTGINYPTTIKTGNNSIYVSGTMVQTLDVDISLGTFNLVNSEIPPGSNSQTSFLAKYSDFDGTLQWAFSLEGTGNAHTRGMDINSNENIVLVGQFSKTFDFDPSIDTLKHTGFYSIQAKDIFIAIYDSLGNYIWSNSSNGDSKIYAFYRDDNWVKFTDDSTLVIAGNFLSETDFAPGTASNEIVSYGGASSFVAKYSICETYSSIDTVYSCGPYAWNNHDALDSSGIYQSTLTSIQGCDSIAKLALTVYPLHSTYESISTCESFTWTNGVTYDSSGTYHYVLSDMKGCDSTLQLNLDITPFDTSISLLNDSTLSANNNQADSYQWVDCNNNYSLIVGETNQSIVLQTNGSYAVILAQNACSDTSACYIIDNLQTPELHSIIPITIFPNPTSGNIKVDISQTVGNLTIHVSDVTGRNILEKTLIDVENFNVSLPNESGVYFISITSVENGIYRTFKIIKN